MGIYIFQVSCPLSLPLLPISIKIPVTLLQIVCICMTAISMNYLFANLPVTWLSVKEMKGLKFNQSKKGYYQSNTNMKKKL